ncbi:CRISPR-associated protein (TIGR03986 family) [Actinoalloteichus hoggarensis]|uniref:RAMP superfamily protein n=1 Tax=Actinoalloteichus hoggarensis TaxID=1470176 RepID=A0A221W766_9PSEU|nr:TIGR03986 family CRISPR-associated RAMP protein [Actinoalloteichus hoggarensis]ASO21523.1 RAMP superfamily protein [Actinoalloteichus hoggarensis]MBB5922113.1 CRISPR-associated protein (TIGR03986 family) [Actinoalloteichus hoggarensis]
MPAVINPYTFVPFPEVDPHAFRRPPAGHTRLGPAEDGRERYSGRVEVVWTNRSPLHLATGETDDAGVAVFPRRRSSADGDLRPFLPGSTVAGVVRNLHENLVGGCLRIFDADFTPDYRDEVVDARSTDAGRQRGWTLARVLQVRDGRPSVLTICRQVVWIESGALAEALGDPELIVTGEQIVVDGVSTNARKQTVKNPDQVKPGRGWVLLVSDAAARPETGKYYVAAGRLGDQEYTHAEEDDPAAWQRFTRLVDSGEDRRLARRAARESDAAEGTGDDGAAERVAVRFGPAGRERLIGYRHRARRTAYPGQVLWVRCEDGEIVEFAQSAVWRHVGSGAAGERVPPELLACSDARQLCPTCRVFGSVDAEGSPTGEGDGEDLRARQRAYRGHLRFADGILVNEVTETIRRFPMLSTPRPGAGQSYLEPQGRGRSAPLGRPALREWGSGLDGTGRGPRRLRGRKHYWLTRDYARRPFFRLSTETMPPRATGAFGPESSLGRCLEPGGRFRVAVSYENLDLVELGGLLAALDPALVLRAADETGLIGFAVGHARPLGLGSCTSEITALTVDTARSRYGGASQPTVTIADAVSAFTAAVDPGVHRVWAMLTSALTLDHVDPSHVYYPTPNGVPAGPLEPADLEPDFTFWQESRGVTTSTEELPLIVLPEITDPPEAQFLPRPQRRELPKPKKNQGRSAGGGQRRGKGKSGRNRR